nr:hypothetical protein BaRGS_002470 [Batillaria attramentaria]
MFDSTDHLHVRYLDLSGSSKPPLDNLNYMGELDLSNNNLTALSDVTFTGLHNVTHLDLSNNPLLTHLDVEFRVS